MAKNSRSENIPVANLEAIQNEINLMMNIADIETRLAADPRLQRFGELADAYLAQGEIDESIQICQDGMKLFPYYGTAQIILAKAYQQKGDRNQASAILQEYLNTHPSSIAAHRMMGDFALEEKNVRKALKHFRIALRLDPVNRNLIQQFVEIRDEFQKIKDTMPSDEDDLDDSKPVIKKEAPPSIKPEKTIERVLDEVLDIPESLKEREISEQEKSRLIEEPAAEPFTFDAEPAIESIADKEPETVKEHIIQESPASFTDEIITRDTQDLLPDDEIEPVRKPVKKELPPEAEGMNPVYVDETGVMYFYDDDEVSFEQYKKRYDLQKIGKAKIMNRARLDEKLAILGIAEPAKTDEFSFGEESTVPEDVSESFPSEPVTEKASEMIVTETIEEAYDVTPGPEEEPEAFEEETAFEDMEISYRDYLDILTEESDLIEAMMGEGPQEPVTEEIATDLINKIVGVTEAEEEPAPAVSDDEISYSDYFLSLSDNADILEADLSTIPAEDQEDKDRVVSLAEFARELDLSDELIDFETFRLFSATDDEELFEDAIAETGDESDAVLKYKEYLDSLDSDNDISEADLSDSTAESITAVTETASIDQSEIITPVSEQTKDTTPEAIKQIASADTLIEPESVRDIKEKQSAVVEEVLPPEKTVPEKKVIAEKIDSRAETKTAATTATTAEAVTETDKTAESEEYEEEIDPRDASLELVDQLAQFGQFGTAYKVCKMLKLKNPTDAKVDRKILELKRLYLWSSQYVG